MSLMLETLKRIEAKRSAAAHRATETIAASEEPSAEPPPVLPIYVAADPVFDAPDPPVLIVDLPESLFAEPVAEPAAEPVAATTLFEEPPAPETFEALPELAEDSSVTLSDDALLPNPASFESTMSDLIDLIAAAQSLEQPEIAVEAPSAEKESLSLTQEAWSGEWRAEDVKAEPLDEPTAGAEPSDFVDSSDVVIPSADLEPPVVEPVGVDPYAATAWNILQQLPQGRAQTLLFTSPADGHGKTMTLARLLPHWAEHFAGRILAIDANTRNPDLARWMEVPATWRLTDVLSGATHWSAAVQPTSMPRVALLCGGTAASGLNLQAAARLLGELAAHFDLVIIDATSLAHDGAAQLSAVCDGTYLVVRLGESPRRVVRSATRVIASAGGRLRGCIAVDGRT